MDRTIPFDKEEICDICGGIGAFDFMGDFLCAECVAKLNKRNKRDEQKTSKKRPKHISRHRASGGRDGRPEDI